MLTVFISPKGYICLLSWGRERAGGWGAGPGSLPPNAGAPAESGLAGTLWGRRQERTWEAARLPRQGWWREHAFSSGLRKKDVGIRADVKLVETGNSLCGEEQGLAGDEALLSLWK